MKKNRIKSLILAGAMVVSVFNSPWMVRSVYAAGGSITVTDVAVSLTGNDVFTWDGSGFYTDPESKVKPDSLVGHTLYIDENTSLVVDGIPYGADDIESIEVTSIGAGSIGSPAMTIYEGAIVNTKKISASEGVQIVNGGELKGLTSFTLTGTSDGKGSAFFNSGTLKAGVCNFNKGEVSNGSGGIIDSTTVNINCKFINYGTVTASNLTINEGSITAESTGEYEIKAGGNLTLSGYTDSDTISGVFILPVGAKITSNGGRFEVKLRRSNGDVSQNSMIISGEYDDVKIENIKDENGKDLKNLLKEEVFLTPVINNGKPVYLGTTFNENNMSVIATGEKDQEIDLDDLGKITYSYKSTYGAPPYQTGLPGTDSIGEYYIYATMEENDYYVDSVGNYAKTMEVEFLELSDDDKILGDDYLKVTGGLENDYYVAGEMILEPKTKYRVSTDGVNYDYSVSVSKDDLNPGYFTIRFKDASTGATTNAVDISTAIPSLCAIRDSLIVDKYDPVMASSTLDGVAVTLADDDTVVGRKLSFKITDEYLDEVELNGVTQKVSGGQSTFDYEVKPGATNDIAIYAGDLAGRGYELYFHATFKKYAVEATVAVDDVNVGEDYTPTITTASDGKSKTIYEYKLAGAEDSAYSTAKPTAAGEYKVRATVPATDKYEKIVCDNTFKISRFTPETAEVAVADCYIGEDFIPVLTTDSDGKENAVFEYKSDADDSIYSTEKPTEAGKYTVRVTIPQTAKYEKAVCYATFNIKKIVPGESMVTVADCYIDDDYEPVLTTDSAGASDAEFVYKVSGADDSTYTTEKPTAAGVYVVKATVPATATYDKITCYDTFTISKKIPKVAMVNVKNTIVGEDYEPVVTTDSDGKAETIFLFKLSGADDSAYTDEKPTAGGNYNVKAVIPETDTYQSKSCIGSFSISKKTVEYLTVSMSDAIVGTAYSPTLIHGEYDGGEAVIEFKPAGTPDTAYSEERPLKAGDYVVRATLAATDAYYAKSGIAEFSIAYLTAPEVPFTIEGITGKNEYYKSDVNLAAPIGYGISTEYLGTYRDSVQYTEGLTQIYLKRNDGALTDAIDIGRTFKIDKELPAITAVSGDPLPEDGSSIYADKYTIKISDDHLTSVTLDGNKVDIVNGAADIVLDSKDKTKEFVIIAEDEAGNKLSFRVTLMATWLIDKVIPANSELDLIAEEEYNLSEGQWVVSNDTTVYNGNVSIYVSEDGTYTFTKVK